MFENINKKMVTWINNYSIKKGDNIMNKENKASKTINEGLRDHVNKVLHEFIKKEGMAIINQQQEKGMTVKEDTKHKVDLILEGITNLILEDDIILHCLSIKDFQHALEETDLAPKLNELDFKKISDIAISFVKYETDFADTSEEIYDYMQKLCDKDDRDNSEESVEND